MIANDTELKGTQDRIAFFQSILAQIRITATPEQFRFMASGYMAEIESMHQEVMEYLSQHSSQQPSAKAS
jgi:pyridoxal/pyridoxine/pyridoxamine kinase